MQAYEDFEGMGKNKAFFSGAASDAIEPIGMPVTIAETSFVMPLLPYLLSFAIGTMLYVVMEGLIPEMSAEKHSNVGTVFFAVRIQSYDDS